MKIHDKSVQPEVRPPEVWRTIPGFGERYQASSEGRIRRMYKTREPRILKIIENQGPCRNQNVVNMNGPDGTHTQFNVLRLVAMAFYPGRTEGKYVVHRNGLHHDNTLANVLILDREVAGQLSGHMGRRKGVCLVNGNGEILEVFSSVQAASDATGVSRKTIRKHCNGGSVWLLSNGSRFRWDVGRGLYGSP